MKFSRIHSLCFAAVLRFAVVADALEMPQPKPGLWEISMQNSFDGAALIAKGATKIIRDAARARL